MQFEDLLTRLDDQALQDLLGQDAMRLIMLLDPEKRSPAMLRNLIVDLNTLAGLLLSRKARSSILGFLKPDEAERLQMILDGRVSGDPYIALTNLRVARGSPREKALFNYFEMTAPSIEMREDIPSWDDQGVSYGLFPHQRRAVADLRLQLSNNPKRVVLHMPTGSGKTRTCMHFISEHLARNEPTLVVWLAYSGELCEQATTEFSTAWKSLGNRSVRIHRFWGDHELNSEKITDGILVAGLAKVYSSVKSGISTIGSIGTRSSLVVIDEAHQAVAETYRLVLDALVIPYENTSLIGLTATPGRTWADIDEDERLATFFARKKVTLAVVGYDNPVRFLVDEGYLAEATFRPLMYESGLELTSQDLALVRQALDIPDSILQKLAQDEMRNIRIILEIEEICQRHDRILLFATTVGHSDLIAAILRARGVNAASVTGKTSEYDRKRAIDEFRSTGAEPMVLANYGVLTTGFDAPKTSAAVIARPTKSLVLYSQMSGRAMRGPKAGGNKESEIITVVDRDLPGFHDFADAFYNWEDVWE